MTGMDDLATWLRAQLDHHADVHRKLVEAEGDDPTGEREIDPDGFWALWDAHDGMFNELVAELSAPDLPRGQRATLDALFRLLGSAYRHADGYRDEWQPPEVW
ncbi:hypothetical protein [Saccharothrix stipae]